MCVCVFLCVVGERLNDMDLTSKQWNEIHYDHAKCIEVLWDGVGQWREGNGRAGNRGGSCTTFHNSAS